MSLATRCTHCGTIFKVVQDQLKVSEGWVRCGRCNEVFNALPALFDLETEAPPPRVTAPPPAPSVPPAPETSPAAVAPEAEPVPENEAPAEAPLTSQNLLAGDDINLGLTSQPPSGWEQTQPGDYAPSTFPAATRSPPAISERKLTEDDLSLEPRELEATTDFELDTSIAIDDNTPMEVVLAVAEGRPVPRQHLTPPAARPTPPEMSPAQAADNEGEASADAAQAGAQPWLTPPQDVPSTDEADALDSRYLLPSERVPRVKHRRGKGPEFADAEFPTDAMIDAEEDWASDFGPSALDPEPAPPAQTPARAVPPKGPSAAPIAPPVPTPVGGPATEDDITTLPSRFASDFQPEHSLPPPSERPGASGTRGRDPADQTPEFLRRAQRQAFWRHPAVRGVLSVLALGLVLTLVLQLTHQFRDLIAAYHPASRPLLTQWCEVAGCKLGPPLRLEALQVDNLELVRTSSEGPDSYRLTVVIHNQSGIDLAWPHVDLTLTDEAGAVIARRVFAPQDAQWLDTADPKADAAKSPAPAASVPTAAPSQRSTTLQWRLKASDLRPAGYTAELFYP
jgi:predicted Zn finger-like uncharacterized protein